MKFLIFLIPVMLFGCAPLREFEHRDIDSRVLGIDASIPIPFAQGANLMNIRMGWIETTYSHGYKTYKAIEVDQEINYIGKVRRKTYMGIQGNDK